MWLFIRNGQIFNVFFIILQDVWKLSGTLILMKVIHRLLIYYLDNLAAARELFSIFLQKNLGRLAWEAPPSHEFLYCNYFFSKHEWKTSFLYFKSLNQSKSFKKIHGLVSCKCQRKNANNIKLFWGIIDLLCGLFAIGWQLWILVSSVLTFSALS
jgi:hypothetical protein